VSKEDVHDLLENPPPRKLITNEDGIFVAVMEISDVLQVPYRRCRSCAARFRCSRAQKEGKNFSDVECVIEKEALDVVLSKLTLDGVTSQDELLVFPLIRNIFQLIRLYELESVQDLSSILRNDEAMKTYKEINGMINKSEQLAKKLGAKKNASQNQTISEGKAQDNT